MHGAITSQTNGDSNKVESAEPISCSINRRILYAIFARLIHTIVIISIVFSLLGMPSKTKASAYNYVKKNSDERTIWGTVDNFKNGATSLDNFSDRWTLRKDILFSEITEQHYLGHETLPSVSSSSPTDTTIGFMATLMEQDGI
jgi:hypothetical protein